MLALWIVPDWIGSGDPLRTFHSARVSNEPHALQRTGTPWLGLVRGAGAIAPAPVWIGTVSALALWWRNRDRTVAALALVAAAWTLPTVIGTALGYPAVPRYLFGPSPSAACSPGSASSRSCASYAIRAPAPAPRWR